MTRGRSLVLGKDKGRYSLILLLSVWQGVQKAVDVPRPVFGGGQRLQRPLECGKALAGHHVLAQRRTPAANSVCSGTATVAGSLI